MRQLECDIWTRPADAICITTNGIVKQNGQCVMGRGIALGASRRYYGIATLLGKKISKKGNRVHLLTKQVEDALPYLKLPRKEGSLIVGVPWHIISFPVKHHWREKADLKLIKESCSQLRKLLDKLPIEELLLPRPGCGNGGLKWKKVKPVLQEYFGHDDRVIVVTNSSKKEKD